MAQTAAEHDYAGVKVSFVMPCLNEAGALPTCIANAHEAAESILAEFGLASEIVIADNGSTDGSQAIAEALGCRVISVAVRGYGAALTAGIEAALGQYVVMGDADGSYDFRQAQPMVEALARGVDLCMGSRFKGEIRPGAMPWKNRYIGNPILTGVLNLLFNAGVSDAHSGIRAIRKSVFARLGMNSDGMEFASEMVIKAALLGMRIEEVPVTLSPDLRGRPPHLRPWRDGWRHLRYLMMLSPAWLFAGPAACLGGAGLLILLVAAFNTVSGIGPRSSIGNYWVVLAGAMLGLAHIGAVLAAATSIYGVREGYRRPSEWTDLFARWVTLETMLLAGISAMVAGFACLFGVAAYWSSLDFHAIGTVLPAVAGTALLVIGAQNVLGGFLLAILNGNRAELLPRTASRGHHGAAASRDVRAPHARAL
jgi:glycosyltransferase involved in cell wall biosynthesis